MSLQQAAFNQSTKKT